MTGPDLARAGERLRRQIESLGELRNAGARDQRFKVWRQETLTLLQRLWPGDHVKAERFRRIPFSAPAARSERGGAREYFERGCKEAEVYLERLAIELGIPGGSPALDPHANQSEADVPASTGPEAETPAAASGPEIPMVPESPVSSRPAGDPPDEAPPADFRQQTADSLLPAPAVEPLPPPARKPITFRPASSAYETLPISFLGPERRKTPQPPGSAGPWRRREDVPPTPAAMPEILAPPRELTPPAADAMPASEPTPAPMPPMPASHADAAAPATPPAPAADPAASGKPRPKMRLKDMLGFGDAPAAGLEPVTPHSPAPSEMPAAAVPVEVPMGPGRGTTRTPVPAEPGDPREDPRRDYAAEFILESPVLQSQAHPLHHRIHPEGQPAAGAAATPPPQASPVPATEAAAPRPAPEVIPMPVREPEAVSVPNLAMEPDSGLPPQLAAEEIYELATRALEFGVPPAHAAILRAALIDLARQLENPPIHWAALRETIAFAMDYPELARRLLPRLLPYLSRAA